MTSREEMSVGAGQGQHEDELPAELSRAGEMVDRMINHLLEKDLPPLVVASALLGGSMGLLSRHLGPDALLGILEQAAHSVRSGEFEADLQPAGRA